MEINWDLAPQGAIEIKSNGNIMRFFNSESQWWHGGLREWNSSQNPNDWQTIATRPTRKAVADDEQEGEKWTHTWKGYKCRIVFTEGNSSWVQGHFINTIVHTDSLKPIKPTLTKAQMLERIKYRAISIDDDDEFGAKVREWLENYDITD